MCNHFHYGRLGERGLRASLRILNKNKRKGKKFQILKIKRKKKLLRNKRKIRIFIRDHKHILTNRKRKKNIVSDILNNYFYLLFFIFYLLVYSKIGSTFFLP